ncbi:hypothetical protein Hanom_Chr07g00600701 [Helianthus anomalus]
MIPQTYQNDPKKSNGLYTLCIDLYAAYITLVFCAMIADKAQKSMVYIRLGAVCFFCRKRLQSADHICRHLQEKSWTKCLQSARRRGFVFFSTKTLLFSSHTQTHTPLLSLSPLNSLSLSLYKLSLYCHHQRPKLSIRNHRPNTHTTCLLSSPSLLHNPSPPSFPSTAHSQIPCNSSSSTQTTLTRLLPSIDGTAGHHHHRLVAARRLDREAERERDRKREREAGV